MPKISESPREKKGENRLLYHMQGPINQVNSLVAGPKKTKERKEAPQKKKGT